MGRMVIRRIDKAAVALNAIVPLLLLAWDAITGDLGANPVNFAIRTTGMLTIIFLLLTLAITPLSRLSGWGWLGQFRRLFGLYAFFHSVIHVSLYVVLDRDFNLVDSFNEVVTRPYLFVGSIAVLLMVPLAVTSTNGMIKRIGPARWKRLHQLTYIVAIAGVMHFYMLVKADINRPLVAATVLGLLLGYRLLAHYRRLLQELNAQRVQLLASPKTAEHPKTWSGQLRVASIIQETPDVRTFRLVAPTGGVLPFQFLPGQYLNLTLQQDGKTIRRSYTLASAPSQTGYCEITIKREPNGLASRLMHDRTQINDLLTVTAPAGRFTFTGKESTEILLIAGGVGITPLMSKIRYLTDIGWAGTIRLIYSARTIADIVFQRELQQLQQRVANLHVTLTLTREESTTWEGQRGRIDVGLLKQHLTTSSTARVHLCGPTEMTTPIIAMLRDLGISAEQIHVESFASPSRATSQLVEQAPMPALAAPVAPGQLTFARSQRTITATSLSILELAEENGIDINYDCRSGICGQCKIRLLSGRVHMAAEDALQPTDRSNGIILGCQAVCQGDVVVDC